MGPEIYTEQYGRRYVKERRRYVQATHQDVFNMFVLEKIENAIHQQLERSDERENYGSHIRRGTVDSLLKITRVVDSLDKFTSFYLYFTKKMVKT